MQRRSHVVAGACFSIWRFGSSAWRTYLYRTFLPTSLRSVAAIVTQVVFTIGVERRFQNRNFRTPLHHGISRWLRLNLPGLLVPRKGTPALDQDRAAEDAVFCCHRSRSPRSVCNLQWRLFVSALSWRNSERQSEGRKHLRLNDLSAKVLEGSCLACQHLRDLPPVNLPVDVQGHLRNVTELVGNHIAGQPGFTGRDDLQIASSIRSGKHAHDSRG